jgi:predicted RNA-binding protein with PIN domain
MNKPRSKPQAKQPPDKGKQGNKEVKKGKQPPAQAPALRPHLLIDGYNLAHAWPEAKRQFRHGWSAACAPVVTAAALIHDIEGIRVTVVLDGQEPQVTVERPGEALSFSVVYSPRGVSADGMIETIVRNSAQRSNVTVATDDLALCHSVMALGAFTLNSQALRERYQRAQQEQQRLLAQQRKPQAPTHSPGAQGHAGGQPTGIGPFRKPVGRPFSLEDCAHFRGPHTGS